MSKTITTLLLLAVLIVGGIWLFNRNNDDVAVDTNDVNASENYGTGGPDEGYDPLDEDLEPKG